jgi:hypothetical protein
MFISTIDGHQDDVQKRQVARKQFQSLFLLEYVYCICMLTSIYVYTDRMAGRAAAVTVAHVLELRATGLTESETWSVLCQATQALQDLFLSSK